MFLLIAMLLAQSPSAPDLAALSARTQPAVVKLIAEDMRGEEQGSGTGFFISADGRIVTNHHVIESAPRLVALLSDKRKVPIAGLLADDSDNDLALLQAEKGTYPFLSLGEIQGLKVGDPVAVIGSPIGLEGSLSNGIVSAIRNDGTDIHGDKAASWKLQITAPISPGSSGSPVLGGDGRVVGVAVGRIVGGEGLNFAIPVDLLSAMLAKTPPDAKPRPLQSSSLVRNLAISAGVFLLIGLLLCLARKSPAPQSRARSGRAAT